ncbi:uncharacterized protein LOC144645467 isoform X1 [Oculina patagonica]
MSKQEFVKKLEATINRKVAVVEDPKDTTGHADGVLSFVEKDVLLIALYDGPDGQRYYDSVKSSVLKVFPGLTVIPLPSYTKKSVSHGFGSAEGSYDNSDRFRTETYSSINLLVTDNALYVPSFNSNQTKLIQENVSDDPHGIPSDTGRISSMGAVFVVFQPRYGRSTRIILSPMLCLHMSTKKMIAFN